MQIDELKDFNIHFKVLCVDEIDSTNTYLKNNYNNYYDKTVLYAHKQTAGRGRYKRVWDSNDTLCFSILLHEKKADEIIAPLAVVLALADFNVNAKIKWPNDVYLNGKKLAGILIEDIYMPDYKASVIGIGINLKSKNQYNAIGLENYQIDSMQLLSKILDYYYILIAKDINTLISFYRDYSIVIGHHISHLGNSYLVTGINEKGYLIAKSNDETIYISSDEINIKEELIENDW